jgi:uncharacterized membrane protein YbhN (UPF0104 family)
MDAPGPLGPAEAAPPSRARRVLRAALFLTGVAFMAVAFARTADRLHGSVVPSAPRLVAAVVLLAGNVGLAGLAWSRMFDVDAEDRRILAGGFYLSQLGKYLPGGVWQVVGQVGSARQASVPLGHASTGFAAFAGAQVIAGAVVASGLAAVGAGAVSPGYRWVSVLGLLSVALLDRRWMAWVLDRLPGRLDSEMLPSQRALLGAWAWAVVDLLMAGTAYAVLLGGVGSSTRVPMAATACAWVAAWAVGFAAILVPAGLGVREAVLIALLGLSVKTPALIAASIVHRLAGIVAEALLIGGHRLATRVRRPG